MRTMVDPLAEKKMAASQSILKQAYQMNHTFGNGNVLLKCQNNQLGEEMK